MKRFLVLIVVALVAAGCSGGSKQGSSGSSLNETDVRLRILDALDGRISFCGPPVIQAGAPVVPRTEFRWIRSQRSVYMPILRHEGLTPGSLTDADVSDVVRVYKEIQSISLKGVGGTYAFKAYTPGKSYEHLVSGSVDASGGVTVQHRTIGRQNCPICL